MTDIVARLEDPGEDEWTLRREAKAAIEQLQAREHDWKIAVDNNIGENIRLLGVLAARATEIERLQAACRQWEITVNEKDAEIKRLRASK